MRCKLAPILQWNTKIESEVKEYTQKKFPIRNTKFIGQTFLQEEKVLQKDFP